MSIEDAAEWIIIADNDFEPILELDDIPPQIQYKKSIHKNT
jgi:hypothetical protein